MAPRLKYKNIEFLKKLGNSDKPSLTKINKVLEILNNPHKKNMGIKIAISGTNGKGSVAKSLSEILNKSKYRVGLYTSPHIFDINERIQINNKKISSKELNEILGIVIHKQKKANIQLSYFELLTVASIFYFSKAKNNINIFEVGLGGKYDATNIIDSQISIITNVSKDHTEYLGNTISKIAKEKVGIVKKDSYLITSANGIGLKVIKNCASKKTNKIFIYNKDFKVIPHNNMNKFMSERDFFYQTNLIGSHQIKNISLSIKTCEILNRFFKKNISTNNISKSLININWPARFQILSNNPLKIIDVAHNIDSVQNLIDNIRNLYPKEKFNILVAMLKDKEPLKCINLLLPFSKKIFFFDLKHKRSFKFSDITKKIKSKRVVKGSDNDIELLMKNNDSLLITGSLYFIGEKFKKYKKKLKF